MRDFNPGSLSPAFIGPVVRKGKPAPGNQARLLKSEPEINRRIPKGTRHASPLLIPSRNGEIPPEKRLLPSSSDKIAVEKSLYCAAAAAASLRKNVRIASTFFFASPKSMRVFSL